jgi:2-isopropylmalate synthase
MGFFILIILSATINLPNWARRRDSAGAEEDHLQMTERVKIFDTTLRDGEQSPGCSMTVPEKVRMAASLADLGVDVLEAGFPIASDGDFDAVRAIAADARGPVVAGLARACTQDIERAARALECARRPRIHTFIATSEVHLRHKLRKSRDQVLEEAVAAVRLARRYADDVEFSAEDATRTDPEYLEAITRAVVSAGAGTVNIPDTVGYSTPAEFGSVIARLAAAVNGTAVISVHCHNDLGLAVANSLAAIEAGARQVECTINGIGERAGNCSLEEIVMVLDVRRDVLPFSTGIRTDRLYPASRLLSSLISFGPQPNKAIVGSNAFAHEAGIHQDGVLKERTTYEIMDPASVGVPESKLVLGKHSGRHALRKRCEDLGFSVDREQLDAIYRRFIGLADRKKGVTDEEIARMARIETGQEEPRVAPGQSVVVKWPAASGRQRSAGGAAVGQ